MRKLASTLFATAAICTVPALAVAEHAPPFKILTLDGKTITNKTVKGSVLVLDFWATWCGPCRQVSKIMQSLHSKYAKRGVQIVCVDVKEPNPSKAAVIKYKSGHGYTYPFSFENGRLDKAMNVPELPFVLVIDKSGDISYRHATLAGLEAGVSNAIAKALGK